MGKRIQKFLKSKIFFYFRNNLNGRVSKCLIALLMMNGISFIIFFLFAFTDLRIFAILWWSLFFYSFYHFIAILIYDSRTTLILNKKTDLFTSIHTKEIPVNDLLKLLSCNHRTLTISRARVNYEILNYLKICIKEKEVKIRIITLEDYTLNRLEFLKVQRGAEEPDYENRLFVNGYDYFNIKDVDYVTNLFNDLVQFIKKKYP